MFSSKSTIYLGLILMTGTSLSFARRRDNFSRPFNSRRVSSATASGLVPLFTRNGSRIISVNGVNVPSNAGFYRFNNGQIQFFDQNQNPISGDGLTSQGPSNIPPRGGFLQGAPPPPLGGNGGGFSGNEGRLQPQAPQPPPFQNPGREHAGGGLAEQPRRRPLAPPQETNPRPRRINPRREARLANRFTPANPPPPISLDLEGVDQSQPGQERKAACQTTPVRLEESRNIAGVCKLATYTAAHCVVDELGNPRKAYELPTLGGFSGRISAKGSEGWQTNRFAEAVIPPTYIAETQEAFRLSGKRNTTVKSDGAVLFFTAPCSEFSQVKTVDFAPLNRDGTPQFGNYTWVQKRNRKVGSNRGSSRRLQVQSPTRRGDTFSLTIPSSQGPEAFGVVGGDSGGGIFDDFGRIMASTSGSVLNTVATNEFGQVVQDFRVTQSANGETVVPEHNMTVWAKGIEWAQGVINGRMQNS